MSREKEATRETAREIEKREHRRGIFLVVFLRLRSTSFNLELPSPSPNKLSTNNY